MTEEECRALLTHTQGLMVEAGMDDVVLAVADVTADPEVRDSHRLLRLLDALTDTIALQDRGTAEDVARTFARNAVTSDGEPIAGVEIVPTGEHLDLFGSDAPIDLTDRPDLSDLVTDLRGLREEIESSLEAR